MEADTPRGKTMGREGECHVKTGLEWCIYKPRNACGRQKLRRRSEGFLPQHLQREREPADTDFELLASGTEKVNFCHLKPCSFCCIALPTLGSYQQYIPWHAGSPKCIFFLLSLWHSISWTQPIMLKMFKIQKKEKSLSSILPNREWRIPKDVSLIIFKLIYILYW